MVRRFSPVRPLVSRRRMKELEKEDEKKDEKEQAETRLRHDTDGPRRSRRMNRTDEAVQEAQDNVEKKDKGAATVNALVKMPKHDSNHDGRDKKSSSAISAVQRGRSAKQLLPFNDAEPKQPPTRISMVDRDAGGDVEDGRKPSTPTSRSRAVGGQQGTRRSCRTRSSAAAVSARHPSESQEVTSPRKLRQRERVRRKLLRAEREGRAEKEKKENEEAEEEDEDEDDAKKEREEMQYDKNHILKWLPCVTPAGSDAEGSETAEVDEPKVEPEQEPNVELKMVADEMEPDEQFESTANDDIQVDHDLSEAMTEAKEAHVPKEVVSTELATLRTSRANERRSKETVAAEQKGKGKGKEHFVTPTVVPAPLQGSWRRMGSQVRRRSSDRRNSGKQGEVAAPSVRPPSPVPSSSSSQVRRQESFAEEALARADPRTPTPISRRTESGRAPRSNDYPSTAPKLVRMFQNVKFFHPNGSPPTFPPGTPPSWRRVLFQRHRPSWQDTPSRGGPVSGSPPHLEPPLGSRAAPPFPSPPSTRDHTSPLIPEPISPSPPSPPPPPPSSSSLRLPFSVAPTPESGDHSIDGSAASEDEDAALYAPIPGNPLLIGTAASSENLKSSLPFPPAQGRSAPRGCPNRSL